MQSWMGSTLQNLDESWMQNGLKNYKEQYG
jgi:hypothetical protein